MKCEFDQTALKITNEETGQPIFKCNCFFQYRDLVEKLLSPSQFTNHIAYSRDGLYNISNKRLIAGNEYMKKNPWQ